MTDAIRFYFDPLCPWCYQTSRWARRLAELGEVELTWGLFSLEVVNSDNPATAEKGHARSAPALRTMVMARQVGGHDAVGALYAAVGARYHEHGQPLEDPDMIREALEEIDIDPGLFDKALGDASTWDAVVEEHTALVERTRSFGVPTVVLDGGDGPAIFGPVIADVPDDEDAVELFRHVAWLARYDNFAELKRDRVHRPALASFRPKAEG